MRGQVTWTVADVGDTSLLFSEAAQEIYELNASAAFVWRSLTLERSRTTSSLI